jgi:hypothetical protein
MLTSPQTEVDRGRRWSYLAALLLQYLTQAIDSPEVRVAAQVVVGNLHLGFQQPLGYDFPDLWYPT